MTQEPPSIGPKKGSCPLCKKETVHDFRPFCSKRCKQVDLGRWFQETYTVPDETPLSPEDLPPHEG